MTTIWSIPHDCGSMVSQLAIRDNTRTPTVQSAHATARPPVAAAAAERNERRGRAAMSIASENFGGAARSPVVVNAPSHVGPYPVSAEPVACAPHNTGAIGCSLPSRAPGSMFVPSPRTGTSHMRCPLPTLLTLLTLATPLAGQAASGHIYWVGFYQALPGKAAAYNKALSDIAD